MTINMKVGWDKRFRRNLDEFIRLDRITDDDDDTNHKQQEKKYDTKKRGREGDKQNEKDRLLQDTAVNIDSERNASNLRSKWRI